MSESTRTRMKRSAWWGIAVLALAGVIHVARPVAAIPDGDSWATATRVLDGDTIEVQFADGDLATVRYIGVDAPETVHPRRGYIALARRRVHATRSW